MKLHLLTLTTLLTLSAAQNLSGEPPCASACLSSAISRAGCAPADQACQCGPTQNSIGGFAASCLFASCSATEVIAIESIGLALCAQYSAMLTMKTTTAPATTVTSSSTTLLMGPGPVVSTTKTTTGVNSTVITTTLAPTVTSSVTSAAGGNGTVSSATVKSSGSATTSAALTASSSGAMALLVSGVGGLAALFFAVAATL